MTRTSSSLGLTLLLGWSSCSLEYTCDQDEDCLSGDTCTVRGGDVVKHCYQPDPGAITAAGCAPLEKPAARTCGLPQMLMPILSTPSARFGTSVAASGGNRVLVGSPGATPTGRMQIGQAEVFESAGALFRSTIRLTDLATPPALGDFGKAVALRPDGALVNGDGAVYYFPYTAPTWGAAVVRQPPPGDPMNDFTGAAALGNPSAGSSVFAGFVPPTGTLQRVYAFPSGTGGTPGLPITFPATIGSTPLNGNYTGFGDALAANDSWLLIGAAGTDTKFGFGSLFAYNYAAAISPTLLLVDTREQDMNPSQKSQLGKSVAVSGSCAAVGAPPYSGSSPTIPPFYVYGLTGTQWKRDPTLEAAPTSPNPLDQPGAAIAMDGDLVAVGAPGASSGRGAVTVYQWRGKKPVSLPVLYPPAGPDFATSSFGAAVAVSGDLVVVGASGATSAGMTNAGAVFVYRCPG